MNWLSSSCHDPSPAPPCAKGVENDACGKQSFPAFANWGGMTGLARVQREQLCTSS